jgi:hypothetical protein
MAYGEGYKQLPPFRPFPNEDAKRKRSISSISSTGAVHSGTGAPGGRELDMAHDFGTEYPILAAHIRRLHQFEPIDGNLESFTHTEIMTPYLAENPELAVEGVEDGDDVTPNRDTISDPEVPDMFLDAGFCEICDEPLETRSGVR